MDWQRFERMTIDLFSYEEGIATSDEYGVGGQSQYGIDVIARRRGNAGEEVVSCKLRGEIKDSDLAGWSQDFLKHWQTVWSDRGIKRFVLATTAINTGERQIQDAVTVERRRFEAFGIDFELWGPKQFVHKLRPHRPIAARYLDGTWADIICGPNADVGVQTISGSSVLSGAVVAQLADLQTALSGQIALRAESALDDLRAGRTGSVGALLTELRGGALWSNLTVEVQAKILRLGASLAIRLRDLEEADTLNREAEACFPSEEPRIAAQLALEREGVKAALKVLGNPRSVAGLQLLAALLLMDGERDRLAEVITRLVAVDPDDPETLRLAALRKLAIGDRMGALSDICRAEAIAGDWTAIQQAGVIVRYAHGLSPAAGVDWTFYPNPVDISLVRQDDAVQPLLAEALALVNMMEAVEGSTGDLKLWRLALLANSRDGSGEAATYARELLDVQPEEATVVSWCVARHLDVDLTASIVRLKDIYTAGADLYAVRVLGFALAMREGENAAEFLRAHLDAQAPDGRAEAELWIARIEGTTLASDNEDERVPELIRAARERGDWEPVVTELERDLAASPPNPRGLLIAQAMAEFGRWAPLDAHSEQLLAYATPAAVRIVAFAASGVRDHEKVLAIVEAERDRFGVELPADVARLRIDSLMHLGDVQTAIREADAVSAATGETSDQLFRAEIMLSIGNLSGAVPAVRRALFGGELMPQLALRYSQALQSEDPDLARDLWRRATGPDVESNDLVSAMEQAFRLGLDRDMAALMHSVQMRAEAGAQDIRMVTLDDVVELVTESRRAAAETEGLYLDGRIPAHVFVKGNASTLLALYLGRHDGPDGRMLLRPIRHGARPLDLVYDRPWQDWAIHLDITGLLEAFRTDILDIVERHPKPIRISALMPALLMQMERDSKPHQPARVTALRRVREYLDRGEIALAAQAPEGAVTISVMDASDALSHAVSQLVAALVATGLTPGAEDTPPPPPCDAGPAPLQLEGIRALHCDAGAIEDLASRDLLAILVRNFSVTLEAEARDYIDAELATATEQERLAAQATALRKRVAAGIEAGIYQLLPRSRHDAYDGEDGEADNPIVQQIGDILAAPATDGGMVWIDDRMVTGYAHTDAMPVVGIVDVLHALCRDGLIDRPSLRSHLLDLRQSGATFIPFLLDDVIAPLFDAPVRGERIVETDALATLRRSFAASGRIERHLKIGEREGEADRPDEIEYLRSKMRLLADGLEAIWTAPHFDVATCHARSDWLWFNLRATQLNRPFPAGDSAEAHERFEAMQIGSCLDKVMEIGGASDQRRGRRLAYLNWIWERALRQKAALDHGFLDRIADYCAQLYLGLLRDRTRFRSSRDQRVYEQLVLHRVHSLPDPIRDAIFAAPFFAHYRQSQKVISVGSMTFIAARFWKAARTAMRYGVSRLRTREGKKVRLTRDGATLLMRGPQRTRVDDDVIRLVGAAPVDEAQVFEDTLRRLDLGADEADALRRKITEASDPMRRATVLLEASADAPCYRYDSISDRLRQRRPFDTAILHPAPFLRMARFLGFADAVSETFDMDGAFATIAALHSPEQAVRRLQGIPVALPTHYLKPLSDSEIEKITLRARTPMAIIQIASEMRRRNPDPDELQPIVSRLLGAIETFGTAFCKLLQWVEKAAFADPDWRGAPRAAQLAQIWAHADRLLDLFISGSSDPEALAAFFSENMPEMSTEDLLFSRRRPTEAPDPQSMTPAALLYHGLAQIHGTDDASAALGPGDAERALAILTSTLGDIAMPDLSLILRHQEAPDPLSGFLRDRPVSLLAPGLDPDATRDLLVDEAFAVIESGGENAGVAWTQLTAFAAGRLYSAQLDRYADLIKVADIWSMAFADEDVEPVRWRAAIAPMIDRDREWAARQVMDLATKCSTRFGRDLYRHEGSKGEGTRALSELVEISALAASADRGRELETFCGLLAGLVSSWPASSADMRMTINNLLAISPTARSKPLWDLHHYLGSLA